MITWGIETSRFVFEEEVRELHGPLRCPNTSSINFQRHRRAAIMGCGGPTPLIDHHGLADPLLAGNEGCFWCGAFTT